MILVKHYNIIICHNVLYSHCGLLFIKVTRNENIFTISKYYFHYILDIYSDLSDNTVVIHLLSINPFPYPLSIFLAIYIYPSSIYPSLYFFIDSGGSVSQRDVSWTRVSLAQENKWDCHDNLTLVELEFQKILSFINQFC